MQYFARRHRFVLQCDVRQFFPGLDHDVLRIELETRIADPRALWLIDRILETGAGILDDAYEMVSSAGSAA